MRSQKPCLQLHILFALMSLSMVFSTNSEAQSYPSKPVHYIVAQAPGSSADIVARYLSSRVSAAWGQPVVVENKPGANGIVGMQFVAKAQADGYTIGMSAPSNMTINQFLYKNVPYKPMEDFAPVTQLTKLPIGLVINPSLPVKTVGELVEYVKQRPGTLNYSSAGIGNLGHLATELLISQTNMKIQHIPNKGDTPALMDLMGGQTQFMSLTLSSAVSYVKSGKLKLLAVYGRERLPAFPEVPTVAESGYPKVIVEGWTGLIVPKATAADVIAKIQTEYAKALADPEVMKFLAGQGQESVGSTPAAYASFLLDEADKWAKVVRGIGLQLNN